MAADTSDIATATDTKPVTLSKQRSIPTDLLSPIKWPTTDATQQHIVKLQKLLTPPQEKTVTNENNNSKSNTNSKYSKSATKLKLTSNVKKPVQTLPTPLSPPVAIKKRQQTQKKYNTVDLACPTKQPCNDTDNTVSSIVSTVNQTQPTLSTDLLYNDTPQPCKTVSKTESVLQSPVQANILTPSMHKRLLSQHTNLLPQPNIAVKSPVVLNKTPNRTATLRPLYNNASLRPKSSNKYSTLKAQRQHSNNIVQQWGVLENTLKQHMQMLYGEYFSVLFSTDATTQQTVSIEQLESRINELEVLAPVITKALKRVKLLCKASFHDAVPPASPSTQALYAVHRRNKSNSININDINNNNNNLASPTPLRSILKQSMTPQSVHRAHQRTGSNVGFMTPPTITEVINENNSDSKTEHKQLTPVMMELDDELHSIEGINDENADFDNTTQSRKHTPHRIEVTKLRHSIASPPSQQVVRASIQNIVVDDHTEHEVDMTSVMKKFKHARIAAKMKDKGMSFKTWMKGQLPSEDDVAPFIAELIDEAHKRNSLQNTDIDTNKQVHTESVVSPTHTLHHTDHTHRQSTRKQQSRAPSRQPTPKQSLFNSPVSPKAINNNTQLSRISSVPQLRKSTVPIENSTQYKELMSQLSQSTWAAATLHMNWLSLGVHCMQDHPFRCNRVYIDNDIVIDSMDALYFHIDTIDNDTSNAQQYIILSDTEQISEQSVKISILDVVDCNVCELEGNKYMSLVTKHSTIELQFVSSIEMNVTVEIVGKLIRQINSSNNVLTV